MFDLVKAIMDKPLQGIVAVLCVVVLTIHLGLTEVKLVQAQVIERQVEYKRIGNLVYTMNETLIRVDENLIRVKEDINQLNNK